MTFPSLLHFSRRKVRNHWFVKISVRDSLSLDVSHVPQNVWIDTSQYPWIYRSPAYRSAPRLAGSHCCEPTTSNHQGRRLTPGEFIDKSFLSSSGIIGARAVRNGNYCGSGRESGTKLKWERERESESAETWESRRLSRKSLRLHIRHAVPR